MKSDKEKAAECWKCGKIGHFGRNCWTKPSNIGGKSGAGAKASGGKGAGKGGKGGKDGGKASTAATQVGEGRLSPAR